MMVRPSFDVAGAADLPGIAYDLVVIFDALFDMPDPLSAATHIRESLKPDGTSCSSSTTRTTRSRTTSTRWAASTTPYPP
jgi:2-polyprenyl-3-methyl-5-hydroxy-6-metoxy-1,4-benzoquinol methylase